MTKFVQEDWERAHLLDEMYLKEMEFQEQENFAQWKPVAKISVKLPKILKNGRKKAKEKIKAYDKIKNAQSRQPG